MGSNRILKMSARLFEPVDAASLVFFRVTFGLITLWHVSGYWLHVDELYLSPLIHFKFYGFGWVRVLPGDGMYYLIFLLGFLASLVTLGLFYQIATILFFFGITYVFLITQGIYLNHVYLICLLSFLLIFIPCHRSFSLDAIIFPKARSKFAPAWCVWLLRVQIGLVYFYGGIAKLNSDWLHGEPMRTWLAGRTGYPVLGQFFKEEWFVYLISHGGLGFDLLIVPLLLFRKTRVMGFVMVAGFHLTNNYLFYIGIFPWLMIAATLIFFSPSWPRRLIATIQRKEFHLADDVASLPSFSPSHRLLTTLCLTLYLCFQLLVPLRHFLYPGNVSWTEEGHRFSWRMRLRSKSGQSIFFVTDPESRRMREYPRDKILDFITPLQYRNMSTRPDMILQFSHYLARRFQDKGYPGVEVRARVLASLNGRAPQLLIDPAVDLVRVKARLWPPAPWVLPLKEVTE